VDNNERGFTLIELLMTMFIMSIVTTAMYQLLFSSTNASERARGVVDVSEEARLGLNRMVRDTREASTVITPASTGYSIFIDYDQNGTIQATPSDPSGNYEDLTFSFNSASKRITVSNGYTSETLIDGVQCILKAGGTCQDVFTFSSSRLEYDTNGDGATSSVELDQSLVGNNNGVLDGQEINFVDVVSYSFRVVNSEASEKFYADAQLRNQR
jgi:prepilin-type N-terminal cleavage/methylation domain-containing protein